MSETASVPAAPAPAPAQAPAPSAKPNTTQATAGAVGGATSAAAVVLIWALGLLKLPVPPEVAVSIVALVTPVVHYVVVRMNSTLPSDPNTGATP